MVIERAVIAEKLRLTGDVYYLRLITKAACTAIPGQFISLYSDDSSHILPRPISIEEIDRKRCSLGIVFRTVGKGTLEFSQKEKGDSIRIMGPLGNGYPLPKKNERVLLAAGGLGLPPLLALGKALVNHGFDRENIIFAAGFKNRQSIFLKNEMESLGQVYISTDDGSYGFAGNLRMMIDSNEIAFDIIYSCGPKVMLKSIKELSEERKCACFISLEERMACGVGACLSCVCDSKTVDGHLNVKKKRVCKDGPVFSAREVEL